MNTPTALDSIAQGRGLAAHPGVPMPIRRDTPTGLDIGKSRWIARAVMREFDGIDVYETDVGSLIRENGVFVKPRWGLDDAMGFGPRVRRVPRRPWALECNAVGVKSRIGFHHNRSENA